MATALVALATTTLASSSATVTFSSISGAYRDLRLVIHATNPGFSAEVQAVFNSDTGSNYHRVYMLGTGSSTASASDTKTFANPGSLQLFMVPVRFEIMDYSATDKQKTMLTRLDQAIDGYTAACAIRWASTAAITSIALSLSGGYSWATGTTLSLYGVSA